MNDTTPNQDFREKLYTIDASGHRRWVYSHIVKGKFFKLRFLIAYSLMAFYLAMPWISIKGRQGVFLNIPERKFIFFGTELWATDTIFLFLMLAGLAISLFFFTALFGRVWCGWACPETVFLEFLFRPLERLIEGSPAQRLKLDMAPWSFEKAFKKALKHGLCAFFAWILASTLLAYFIGREPLIAMMQDWPLNHPTPFFMTLVLMGMMGFQFGWFREQFCTVLCPYARFQSVMMDQNSLVVGYDPTRGEPRGKQKKGEAHSKLGDCIDCGLCVRVCPTGIDIRNGLQLECVACTACIDACDSIMQQIGRPLGLIRYDTENKLKGKHSQILRPRVMVYAFLLVVFLAAFSYGLNVRQGSDFALLRSIGDAPFTLVGDDLVTNHFHAKISNKTDSSVSYELGYKADFDLTLINPMSKIVVAAGQTLDLPIFVEVHRADLKPALSAVIFKLSGSDGSRAEIKVTLLGPDAK